MRKRSQRSSSKVTFTCFFIQWYPFMRVHVYFYLDDVKHLLAQFRESYLHSRCQCLFEFPSPVPPCCAPKHPVAETENIELGYLAAGNQKVIKPNFRRARLRDLRNVDIAAKPSQLTA